VAKLKEQKKSYESKAKLNSNPSEKTLVENKNSIEKNVQQKLESNNLPQKQQILPNIKEKSKEHSTHHTPTNSISNTKIADRSEIYLTPIPNKEYDKSTGIYSNGLTTVSPNKSVSRLNPFSNFENPNDPNSKREPLTSYRERNNSNTKDRHNKVATEPSDKTHEDKSARNFARKVSPFRLNSGKYENFGKNKQKTPNNKDSDNSNKNSPKEEKIKNTYLNKSTNSHSNSTSNYNSHTNVEKSSSKSTIKDVINEDDKETIIYDKPLRSDFLFEDMEDIADSDPITYKIEALKVYLEKKMGFDAFFNSYKYLNSTSNGEEPEDDFSLDSLDEYKAKYIPFIIQLIKCEDSIYGSE